MHRRISEAQGELFKERGKARREARDAAFVAVMRTRAQAVAGLTGSVTMDELRQWADAHGIRPSHPNSWGAIFNRSCGLMRVGFRPSAIASNHARMVGVWAPKGGAA